MHVFTGTPAEWNKFLLEQPTQIGLFLQSFAWGEFQVTVGRTVHRFSDDEDAVRAQIIEHTLPVGLVYWYVPRGPVVKYQITNTKLQINDKFQKFFWKMFNAAKEAGATFLRIEPPYDALYEPDPAPTEVGAGYSQATTKLLAASYPPATPEQQAHACDGGRGVLRPTSSIQPHTTLVIDLSKSDEELLVAMHPKHRYNIRLAERHGVTSEDHGTKNPAPIPTEASGRYEASMEHMGMFLKLLRETTTRDRFEAHPEAYYKKMVETVPNAHLFIAKKEATPLAAHLCIGFGDTLTYLHGTSSSTHRNFMGPHLLHFETMRFARAHGYRHYDLWGIDEKRWPTLTRFKRGFGGFEIQYPGTFDLPISRTKYTLYRMARAVAKIRH